MRRSTTRALEKPAQRERGRFGRSPAVVAVASALLEREALSASDPHARKTMPMTLLAIARSSPAQMLASACERLRWGSLNRRKAW
jgi:hypothetical protein